MKLSYFTHLTSVRGEIRFGVKSVRALGTVIGVAITPFKLAGEPLKVTNYGS